MRISNSRRHAQSEVRMRPHKQSDHLIGYPVPDEDRGELIVIGLWLFGAVCALVTWLRLA